MQKIKESQDKVTLLHKPWGGIERERKSKRLVEEKVTSSVKLHKEEVNGMMEVAEKNKHVGYWTRIQNLEWGYWMSNVSRVTLLLCTCAVSLWHKRGQCDEARLLHVITPNISVWAMKRTDKSLHDWSLQSHLLSQDLFGALHTFPSLPCCSLAKLKLTTTCFIKPLHTDSPLFNCEALLILQQCPHLETASLTLFMKWFENICFTCVI